MSDIRLKFGMVVAESHSQPIALTDMSARERRNVRPLINLQIFRDVGCPGVKWHATQQFADEALA